MRNWAKATLVVALLAVAAVGVRAQFMGKAMEEKDMVRQIDMPSFNATLSKGDEQIVANDNGVFIISRVNNGLRVIHFSSSNFIDDKPAKTVVTLEY